MSFLKKVQKETAFRRSRSPFGDCNYRRQLSERRKSIIAAGIAEGRSPYSTNESKTNSIGISGTFGEARTVIDRIEKTALKPKISFLNLQSNALDDGAFAPKNTKTTQKVQPKIYTSYSKLSEVILLTIGIASPLRILQWAEKTLPNGKIYGEVLNANTLHHKTFKPQKGGLFCQRIFGPLKDFECACGKH